MKDIWNIKTEMPTKRFGPSGGAVNGKIYVIGGAAGNDALAVNEVYDPNTDIWMKLPDMPVPKFAAACVLNDQIYFIGGALTVKPPHPAISTVEVFTPSY